MIALMLAVFVTGMLQGASHEPLSAPIDRVASVYLPMAIVQLGLLAFVARIGRSDNALARLIGERWTSAGRAAADIALAALVLVVIEGGEILAAYGVDTRHAASVVAMLPHSLGEKACWVVVATLVGLTEEVVYRGYLQTQLGVFTKSVPVGILLQALLFGMAHGEQGALTAARFALYGAGLGALAQKRKSLVPGILGHIVIDLWSGLA